MLRTCCLLFLLPFLTSVNLRQLRQDRAAVALCLSVKDEHPGDLREWVAYHLAIGADKIFVYDNNSTEPLAAHLVDFLRQGSVEYHYLTAFGHPQPQFYIYNMCLKHQHSAQFMGFIDSDEFIVIPDGRSLANVLLPYAGYGGLAINWRCFGSSGHQHRPSGGVLANYVKCFPSDHGNNALVKTIAVTLHTRSCNGPHSFNYFHGYFAVNTAFVPVPHAFSPSPPDWSKIHLYHYVTKSRDDYTQKMHRGAGDGTHKPPEFFDIVNRDSTADCTLLQNFSMNLKTLGSL